MEFKNKLIEDVLSEFPTAINDDNYMDFFQEGNKALLLASETYKEGINYDFSSYATQIIECEIINYIMGYNKVIGISSEMLNQIKEFDDIKKRLEQESKKSLSIIELTNKTGYSIEQIVNFIKYNLFKNRTRNNIDIKDNAVEDIMISTRM